MFRRQLAKRSQTRSSGSPRLPAGVPAVTVEPLEDRRLLSASRFSGSVSAVGGHSATPIEFSQAPAAVQSGLTSLGLDRPSGPADRDPDGLPPKRQRPGNLQHRHHRHRHQQRADRQAGRHAGDRRRPRAPPRSAPSAAPATGSNAAAANEITAIATALNLTAPTATTSIKVSTASTGVSTYTVRLSPASTTTTTTTTTTTPPLHFRTVTISVDSNGNPVGNQSIPFSAIPTSIQTALNKTKPSGATALAATATQTRPRPHAERRHHLFAHLHRHRHADHRDRQRRRRADQPAQQQHHHLQPTCRPATPRRPPSYRPWPPPTASPTAIATGQTVNVYDEGNGTTIYSVTVGVTQTTDSGFTYTRDVTVSVDQAGNPTTLPQDGGGRGGFGGFGGFGFGGFAASAAWAVRHGFIRVFSRVLPRPGAGPATPRSRFPRPGLPPVYRGTAAGLPLVRPRTGVPRDSWARPVA